eukprot:2032040-Rhodomonas_salina.1
MGRSHQLQSPRVPRRPLLPSRILQLEARSPGASSLFAPMRLSSRRGCRPQSVPQSRCEPPTLASVRATTVPHLPTIHVLRANLSSLE